MIEFSDMEIRRWAQHVLAKANKEKDIAGKYGILKGEIGFIVEHPEVVRTRARKKFTEVL